MFNGCSGLTTIYASETFKIDDSKGGGMFSGCTSLVGGAGTTYDSTQIGGNYAHIDGAPENPGYFTKKTN